MRKAKVMVEDERISTVMQLMFDSNSAHPQRLDTQSAQSSLTRKLSKEADPSPAHVWSCIHGSSAEKALPQCVQLPFQHFGGC